jgi:serine/threonine protein kinase
MGSVYLAEHVHLRRSTAIKLLRPDFGVDPEAEARFRREAMLAARISHPRIARVYDFDPATEGAARGPGGYGVSERGSGRCVRSALASALER